MTQNNAIIRSTAASELEKRRDSLAAVLPRNVDPDRFYHIALSLARDPALSRCTVPSVLSAVYRIAKLGLDPDPVMGEVWVLPRNLSVKTDRGYQKVPTACMQLGYRGLTKLARNTRQIADIHAEVVYEGEEFNVDLGTARMIHHVPYYVMNIQPGAIRLAYCTWTDTATGRTQFHITTLERIERARNANKDREGNPSKVWQTDEVAMVRKTAMLDAKQEWPLSAEMAEAVTADEQTERGEPNEPVVLPGIANVPVTGTVQEQEEGSADELNEYGQADLGAGEVPPPPPPIRNWTEFYQKAQDRAQGTMEPAEFSLWLDSRLKTAGVPREAVEEIDPVVLTEWMEQFRAYCRGKDNEEGQ